MNECIEYAQNSVNDNINISDNAGVYLIIWKEEKGFFLEFITSKSKE